LGQVLIRDVAEIRTGTMPGQYDRYNMKRQVTLTANRVGVDLGTVSREVTAAIKRAGDPPKDAKIEIRGQIPPMNDMTSGLSVGLIVSIVAVFLLLTANFQSIRLALVAVSSVPAAGGDAESCCG
jgi:multidrug efflux pump subunit AcrB